MADVKFSIEALSLSKSRTEVKVRDFTFNVDEPEKLGGTNTGPNPVEYQLGSLAGCLNVTAYMIAKEMGFVIESMNIKIEGNLDPLSFLGKKPDVRAGFKEIRVYFDVKTSASSDVLTQWTEAIEKRCPEVIC